MQSDFPRILTLLRKEKAISQKQAAVSLGISQALLSHYEKGIRECGLDFLVRAADFYGVSCDYLLGRSPERDGAMIAVEDIPEPDAAGKENALKGGLVPLLNKKLLANSLNVLFDLLRRANNKALTQEMSSYLMLAIYKMFRLLHAANPDNEKNFFHLSDKLYSLQASGAMQKSEADVLAILNGLGDNKAPDCETFAMSTESLTQAYPLFASSLYNLIQNAENKIEK